jgi:hypothetical protein
MLAKHVHGQMQIHETPCGSQAVTDKIYALSAVFAVVSIARA